MQQKTNMSDFISVVIPTYNRAKVLRNSIESVLSQTYENFELVVVDDGSTDDTSDVMKKYILDKRIKYIRLNENAGVSNARNVGVKNSSGEWIAFQDSDDCWRVNKLEKQVDYIHNHPDCKLVYSAYEYHHMPNTEKKIRMPEGEATGKLICSLLSKNRIGAVTVIVNREVFEDIGGFDTSYPALEDWDFAIKAAMNTNIGYIDEVLVDANYTEGSISRSGLNYYKARCMLIAKYRTVYENNRLFDASVLDMFNSVDDQNPDTINLIKNMLMKALLENIQH